MLDPKRWPHGDDILEQALERPVEERRDYVRQASAGDADLLAALEAVLDEAEVDDGFLTVGGAMAGAVAEDLARASRDDSAGPPRLRRGDHFGAYDVTDTLGQGGMGEVYRARDTRLGRDVALKVLPLQVAAHPESLARFEREARLLASLNHAHIAAIYDVEEHDGVLALVLELVEGPTLADRLRRGPVPLDEVIDIASEIAEALEAAHRRGVVHRDLKPANIKLSSSGDVKVLDFGIAKALAPDHAGLRVDADAPTIAATAGIRPGGILGTAPYVSPEHARGQTSDHRADIWAFGCVLYELLTGTRAFDGTTSTEVLARVLERDPDMSRLPEATPEALRRLLRRTLSKDPDRRLGYIGDALLELEDARLERRAPRETPAESEPARPRLVVAIGAATLVVGLVAGIAATWMTLRPQPPAVSFLSIPVPDADDLIAGELPGIAISPDGRTIVYRAWRDGVIQLIRRSFDGTEAEPIPGSAGGASPFFSPDGQWIGFTSEAELMKIPVTGGMPVRLTDAPGGARGTWSTNGTIYFSTGARRLVYSVPETGGDAVPVTRLDEAAGHLSHESPSVLPDGASALVTMLTADERWVGLADFASGQVTALTPGQQPRYLSSGHVVLVRGDAIWAAAFDVASKRLTSDPIVLVEGIELGSLNGTAHFALADDGSLAYLPARPALGFRTPVWVDRHGSETAVAIEPRGYTRASLSPDGSRIALAQATTGERDVWIFDLSRSTFTRLTSDPATDTAPVWSSDGSRIAFRSEREGGGIFVVPSDGAADPVRVTRSDGPARPAHTPYAFTPDDRYLLFTELRSYSDQGIARVALDGRAPPEVVIDDPEYAETRPALSPDGAWLAYQSDETGRYEVYLRSYPDVNGHKLPVSTSGGTSPRWSRDGGTVYFHDGANLVGARVETGATVVVHPPEILFEASRFNERLGPLYDVTPDDQRFLFLREGGPDGAPPRRTDLRLIQHFVERIRERVGR